jgi:hypothetical protein
MQKAAILAAFLMPKIYITHAQVLTPDIPHPIIENLNISTHSVRQAI